jgi:hypothetical protein
MEALTTNPLHFRAASIMDGRMLAYSKYIMGFARSEFETMIGAKPFGEGLQQCETVAGLQSRQSERTFADCCRRSARW